MSFSSPGVTIRVRLSLLIFFSRIESHFFGLFLLGLINRVWLTHSLVVSAECLTLHGARSKLLVLIDAKPIGGKRVDPLLRCVLEKERNEKLGSTDCNAAAPLAARAHGNCSDEDWEVLDEANLGHENSNQDDEEEDVVVESLEDLFVIDAHFPAVNHVEQLQEDEHVESNSEDV